MLVCEVLPFTVEEAVHDVEPGGALSITTVDQSGDSVYDSEPPVPGPKLMSAAIAGPLTTSSNKNKNLRITNPLSNISNGARICSKCPIKKLAPQNPKTSCTFSR